MYHVYFYRDKSGREPVKEYLMNLSLKKDKDSRIKAGKINDYIEILSRKGTLAGEPFVKHIEGEIWELGPFRDRIFFVAWYNEGFVLLHSFMKETKKTPAREIQRAKRELADLIERGLNHE